MENTGGEKNPLFNFWYIKKHVFIVWAFLEAKETAFAVNAKLSPNPIQPICPSLKELLNT